MGNTVKNAESIVKDFDYRVKLATLLRGHMDLAFESMDKDRVRACIKWAEQQATEDNIGLDLLWMPEQAFQDRINEGGI